MFPKHGNSLRRVCAAYPEGAPDKVIAAALMVDESELESIYESIVTKLQRTMT